MEKECIFCQIAAGSIAADKIYEDDDLLAFRDIHPVAPTHVIIIPKTHYASLNELPKGEMGIMAKIYSAIQHIARQEDVADSGYRTILNTNRQSGQEVFHLHFHILGGRQMRGLG